jgi:hypothetical protein
MTVLGDLFAFFLQFRTQHRILRIMTPIYNFCKKSLKLNGEKSVILYFCLKIPFSGRGDFILQRKGKIVVPYCIILVHMQGFSLLKSMSHSKMWEG